MARQLEVQPPSSDNAQKLKKKNPPPRHRLPSDMPGPYKNELYEDIDNVLTRYKLDPEIDDTVVPPTAPSSGPVDPSDEPQMPPYPEAAPDGLVPRAWRNAAEDLRRWVEDHAQWWVAARAWTEVRRVKLGMRARAD